MQHTQAQFWIDRSGIRLNTQLFAQTVVQIAVIMWRELVKRANPSYIFKKMKAEQDATGMFGNRHCLNMHLMLTHGPVAEAWASLRMRRQNFPRPG